jgi:hypothetical protein
VASVLYQVHRSRPHRWVQTWLPVLEQALGYEVVLPERRIDQIESFFTRFPYVKDLWLDGTELDFPQFGRHILSFDGLSTEPWEVQYGSVSVHQSDGKSNIHLPPILGEFPPSNQTDGTGTQYYGFLRFIHDTFICLSLPSD